MFKTIKEEAEALVIEKKSKFIAKVFYVQSVSEAGKIIEETRKRYYDAKHNCYAYRVLEENVLVERQSDDGEPSGTAGAPMLNILSKKELTNVLVIVTRYFGGILLGTGGLVKAYSEATLSAIDKAKEVEKEIGYTIEVIVEYEKQREFEYFCENNKINIISKEYTDKIKNIIEISKKKYEEFFTENAKTDFQKLPVKIKGDKYINKLI